MLPSPADLIQEVILPHMHTRYQEAAGRILVLEANLLAEQRKVAVAQDILETQTKELEDLHKKCSDLESNCAILQDKLKSFAEARNAALTTLQPAPPLASELDEDESLDKPVE